MIHTTTPPEQIEHPEADYTHHINWQDRGRKPNSYKRWLKKQMSKWRRRSWRQMGEDAPVRNRYRGWEY